MELVKGHIDYMSIPDSIFFRDQFFSGLNVRYVFLKICLHDSCRLLRVCVAITGGDTLSGCILRHAELVVVTFMNQNRI